jgi:hypothetical protein
VLHVFVLHARKLQQFDLTKKLLFKTHPDLHPLTGLCKNTAHLYLSPFKFQQKHSSFKANKTAASSLFKALNLESSFLTMYT